jgi:hypothetical protein
MLLIVKHKQQCHSLQHTMMASQQLIDIFRRYPFKALHIQGVSGTDVVTIEIRPYKSMKNALLFVYCVNNKGDMWYLKKEDIRIQNDGTVAWSNHLEMCTKTNWLNAITSLQKVKVREAGEWVDVNGVECGICYDETFSTIHLPCKHVFCTSCLMKWMKVKQNCPMCRRDFEVLCV